MTSKTMHVVPQLNLGRRRSTRTGNKLFRPKNDRRSQSIGTARFTHRIPVPMPDTIDISIALRDLVLPDLPFEVFCTIWENETESEAKWNHIGTSEPIYLSKRYASFDEKFTYPFVFEKTQLIRVDICQFADGGLPSSSEDVIGSCMFKVDELIGSFGLQVRRPLLQTVSIASTLANSRPSIPSHGSVIITGQMGEREQPLIVQFSGKGLDRKDFIWDETAVFFRVFRLEEGDSEDSLVLLYESEAIKNHSHPQWVEFRLGAQDAADNRNRLLEIWVLYRDVDGKEGFIGKFLTTYAKMKYGPGPDNLYNVINETKKQQKKNYEHSGRMELVKFTDVSFYSFLDYIVSGTQLHFEIAVNFSSDSGFHMVDQTEFDSEFQIGMRAIGGILRHYTPNRLFCAFGVGAKIPPTFHESHEFHLNFALDPTCRGLDGVMEAYRKAQTIVTPTKEAKFAPIVQYATRMSQRSGFRGLHYHVLTIFTRSPPTDMKDLQQVLQQTADAPLSVIFMCIGDADFSQLQKLAMKRKDGKRDCVEFIALSELLDAVDSPAQNKARIAEQSLHNLPSHMVSFMHRNNIAAKPPIQVCRSPLFHSSSLIPDRPTEFTFDNTPLTPMIPTRPLTDRRGSDSRFLEDDLNLRNSLTVRVPERCHSVLQTSKEQYQRRLKERGLAKQMRFARAELNTLDSNSCSTQDSLV